MSEVKIGILLAAFGASGHLGETALRAFADAVRQSFPGIPARWAFTSVHMRNRLAAARKKTDSVKKALCRMSFERYTHVAVQSLHLIAGAEYEALLEEVDEARKKGGPARIQVGAPLLERPSDVQRAAGALIAHLPPERRPEEAVVCMGHGTWHRGAAGYEALARVVRALDPHVFIGALEGALGIDALLPFLVERYGQREQASACSRAGGMAQGQAVPIVWLLPLLSVIGKHAEKDMAGVHPASWKSRIETAGFVCRPVLRGTVEYAGFGEIWLAHLATALAALGEERPAKRERE